MKYKCILFDCDGVLVDSEKISIGTLVSMAQELNIPLQEEEAMRLFLGKSLEFCFEYIQSLTDKKLPINFEEDFRTRSFKAFKSNLQPIAGVPQLINKLKVPFCVASNGPADKIRLNLETTHLLEQFEGNIFSAHDINSWKPDPQLYLHAAKTMGFEPKDCVVIEDSPVGVQAAIAGGFAVYGYAPHESEGHFSDYDIPLFDDMNNLYDLLQ
ncbi:HAD family hydrolase [Flavobacterium frigidarium]|uniref:HAD family hydrolase n=1 Tax=Flavobacterium frigidarium TaxID=99286 RepID=UPI0030D94896|tara:strand:- start:696 stop:1331 length:636 start_codon:yes stop_codon:yes gene_type:complete